MNEKEPLPSTSQPELQTALPDLPATTQPALPTILGQLETLTQAQQARYAACEAVLSAGWQTVVESGLALAEIRRDRLYREEFDTFEDYCRARWQFTRARAAHLIAAAQLTSHLSTICLQKPNHESQIRPLAGLSPEQAQLAWTCAVESAQGRKITARLVKKAVQDLGFAPPPKPKPPAQAHRQTRAELRQLINDTLGQLLVLLSQKAPHETLLHHVETLHRHLQPLLEAKPHPTHE